MSSETIFSKIIRKEIPAQIVFESDTVLAFKDIIPQAPQHILVVPKKPIKDLSQAQDEDRALLGEMLLVCASIAKDLQLDASGYRIVINNGLQAGQTVFDLHMHILGGRNLNWPPG